MGKGRELREGRAEEGREEGKSEGGKRRGSSHAFCFSNLGSSVDSVSGTLCRRR